MNERCKDIVRDIARQHSIALSPATLDAIASVVVQKKYHHRKTVINEGEVCDYMFYIEKGLVRQFYHKNGQEVTEHLACEGEIVCCLESFFTRQPSQIMMHTLEPTILYGFPYAEMQELTKHSYEVCKLYFSILEKSLIIHQHKADILRFESAKERYLLTLKYTPEIARRSPLKYLASVLQIRPETLSRVRKICSEED